MGDCRERGTGDPAGQCHQTASRTVGRTLWTIAILCDLLILLITALITKGLTDNTIICGPVLWPSLKIGMVHLGDNPDMSEGGWADSSHCDSHPERQSINEAIHTQNRWPCTEIGTRAGQASYNMSSSRMVILVSFHCAVYI